MAKDVKFFPPDTGSEHIPPETLPHSSNLNTNISTTSQPGTRINLSLKNGSSQSAQLNDPKFPPTCDKTPVIQCERTTTVAAVESKPYTLDNLVIFS